MNFRISEFCHFVSGKNNLVALYNSLTLGIVILDKKTAQSFQDHPAGIIPNDAINNIRLQKDGEMLIEQLIMKKIIFPVEAMTDLEDYQKIRKGLECKRIGILYLLTTDTCNLACSYCFVENAIPSDYKYSMMTVETAEKGIDLFARSLKKSHGVLEPQIIFYGGEPIANFAVIKHSLKYIREKMGNGELPQKTSITINTNGTLINQDVLETLAGIENLTVAISLDGPKSIHDASRKYHSGIGTYDDALKGYNDFLSSGIRVGLCCTINEKNVDQMQEIAEWFKDSFNVKSLGFNIMIGDIRREDDLVSYANRMSDQLIECFRLFRENGIHEDRIMRKVNAFTDGSIYYRDCGGCGEQIVVSPNGMVGTCQGYCGSKKNFVQMSDDFDPLEHPIWEEWRFRSPLSIPRCRDCIALSICGGGCPYSADVRHGSIWDLDDVFCIHAKKTAEFLIQDLIEKAEK